MSGGETLPTTPPQFNIHDRLRKAREVAGLDQQQLATAIGISRQTVGNYERGDTGEATLKRYVLKEWALVCGVPYEWLKNGTETETGPDGGGAESASGLDVAPSGCSVLRLRPKAA